MTGTDYNSRLLVEWRGEASREEVASAIGVGRMTIWRAENGGAIKMETLAKLAAYYGKPIHELLRGPARQALTPAETRA